MNHPRKLSALEAAALGSKLMLDHQKIKSHERKHVEAQSAAVFGHLNTSYQVIAPFSSRTWIDKALEKSLWSHGIDPHPTRWKGHAFQSIPINDRVQIQGTVITVRYQSESGAVMIESAQRVYDIHDDDDRVPISELLFYGARKEQFIPRILVQHTITNNQTNEFIERVIESQGVQFGSEGGVLQVLHDSEWFPLLLGSDNGRAAQQMVNAHPATFQGATVTQIEIVKNDRGMFHLILVIGDNAY